ncbi:ribose-phosphate pyrophosphokinase [Halanaerobium congolense]|uniref:ribose-phosphate diphosphokinase n=1 Tax=Halanaerobium congolense TaxID=54121 RepID=A0A1G6MCP9_9FIRM|nr:ribose-phosphate pyrophosphokinase [Halanaerobium congolense]KXS49992.1 MAG: ribose-phosphate pyrophosphokinase [Halanaerobium sp. T82-1]PUU88610.1 MAG: ribose-phosphate pyrophosphokinase [Halanaerobium sp.]PXV66953.1 ribose-phosphate pyrophosphokinase [Halanaerobium congolense]TDS27903.1 ribose-phosphate pyrophosphokinase [Halanaerobium congolense]SDC53211.1 ribose-phosphate pyrophosphokinase [Halanaerobium congolense]
MEDKTITKIPFGQLGIIIHESCKELGKKVDDYIVERRKEEFANSCSEYHLEEIKESYIIDNEIIRFSNGEAKGHLKETIRGKDIFILADIGNYSVTYNMFGIKNRMSPDDHFQDIKRLISAIAGKARRIHLIMPLLYESRQDKRNSRESLDCAMALQELENMGVENIFTFDAHETRVQNAIPQTGFESLHSTYQIIKAMNNSEAEIHFDKDEMMVISPDTGAMDRAIYYAGVLGLDVGLFYKRRDYKKIVDGRNPIIQHEYMGADVAGKDILIVDDMIASGGSVFDIAKELKNKNARNVYVAVSFTFFTNGIEKMDEYYEKGYIKKLFSTNLTYVPQKFKDSDWFEEVDMSKLISLLIDTVNYDDSVSPILDATNKIKSFIED